MILAAVVPAILAATLAQDTPPPRPSGKVVGLGEAPPSIRPSG